MVAQLTKRIDADGIGTADEFTNVGGADKVASVLVDDGTSSYIDANSGAARTQRFDIDTTFVEKFGQVNAVRVMGRHRSNSGSAVSCRFDIIINATLENGGTFTATTAWATRNTGSLARPGGGDWTDDDFRLTGANRLQFQAFCPSQTPNLWVTELYVEVDYIPLNRAIDLEREVASRFLRAKREPEELITIVNGWEALEAELMDPTGFSHAHGPTHDAQGWGVKDWERGFGRLRRQQISLSGPRVESTIVNRRRFQATLWEVMALTISGDPDIADGLARLDASGADREFSRGSSAWVEDAGGVIKLVAAGKEKITPKGILIEGPRDNFMTQSSFVNGTTGWTKTENSGTGTFAADTTDLLFDEDVSAQSVKLTVTSAPYDIDIKRATDSLSASTDYALALDWKQSAAATQKVAIQNDTTTNWLQSNGSWGASRADLTLGTAVDSIEQDLLEFTTEGTASTHTVFVQFVGSTNGTIHHVYHVQVELSASDGFTGSRIVTEASAVGRLADDLRIRNDSSLAQRIWPIDKFTVQVRFTPFWNSADLASSKVILDLSHDANNGIRILHFNTNSLHFEYEHGGTIDSVAVSTPGMSRNTEAIITIRKTSASGELGLTANTISIFLDGVKGTETTTSDLTQAASSYLQIGALEDVTSHAFGFFGEIFISPIVFSDIEIAAGIN